MNEAIAIDSLDFDTLGGRILRARDLTGMTLEDAAARVGVTAETFAEWETDRSEPRSNKLATLAGVLGISPTWLISGVGDGPERGAAQAGLTEMAADLDRLRQNSEELASSIADLQTRIETMLRAAS